jgi:anti-sigma B factor antagonist
MNQFSLSIESRDGAAVIRVTGEIDVASVQDLDACVRKARSHYSPHLILDLAEVDFMDCTGLRVLADASTNIRNDGGSVAIARPSRQAAHLFEVSGLPQELEIYRTIEQAMDGMRSQAGTVRRRAARSAVELG